MDKAAQDLIAKLAGAQKPPGYYAQRLADKHGLTRKDVIKDVGGLSSVAKRDFEKARGITERPSAAIARVGKRYGVAPEDVRKDKGGLRSVAMHEWANPQKKESSMHDIISDIIKGAEQNTFGRPVAIQTNLDKNAAELIRKMAADFPRGVRGKSPANLARSRTRSALTQMAGVPPKAQLGNLQPHEQVEALKFHRWANEQGEKERQDVLKKSSWTPLDIAKTAGMLVALEEQGYSVKEAADYLGLTEAQVQDIVATVR